MSRQISPADIAQSLTPQKIYSTDDELRQDVFPIAGGKKIIKIKMQKITGQHFFPSGMMRAYRRSSSSVEYNFCGLSF